MQFLPLSQCLDRGLWSCPNWLSSLLSPSSAPRARLSLLLRSAGRLLQPSTVSAASGSAMQKSTTTVPSLPCFRYVAYHLLSVLVLILCIFLAGSCYPRQDAPRVSTIQLEREGTAALARSDRRRLQVHSSLYSANSRSQAKECGSRDVDAHCLLLRGSPAPP